ncbi:MAG: electron transport complex subunit RsxE [Defluviitaleaceae bacterium]|nr:electron transport complex subunit RsxE [Defluviitaleaceae bacterium]
MDNHKQPNVNLKEVFFVNIIRENPVFVMLLSLCPILGVSSNFVNAISIGAMTGLVILLTNIVVSLLSRIIPNEVRIPVLITIIATSVTLMEMLVHAYIPAMHFALGIFLPLIVVNCVVFGRAEAFAIRNKLIPSIVDALGVSAGILLALGLMGFIRELLGTGAIDLFGLYFRLFPEHFAIPLFIMPAGAFIVLGMIIGIIFSVKMMKQEKQDGLLKNKSVTKA